MKTRTDSLIDAFGDLNFTLSDFHRCCYQVPHGKRVFVHVPKTGGSSVHKLLLKHPSKLQFMNVSLKGCHRPVSRLHSPKDTFYFTIIRDPIERVWSYFNMVRHRWISHPYKEYAKVGLEYFLQHCWEARNQYIRYFSSFLLDEPGEYEYRIAIKNLTHFKAVIDFNNFDNEPSRYCTKIGIYPDEQPVPHANKSNYNAANNEEKRLIAFYNRLDVNLYHQWIDSSKKSPFFEQF